MELQVTDGAMHSNEYYTCTCILCDYVQYVAYILLPILTDPVQMFERKFELPTAAVVINLFSPPLSYPVISIIDLVTCRI
jgi:hypothetical protein